MAPHMRPICLQKWDISHEKSPTLQKYCKNRFICALYVKKALYLMKRGLHAIKKALQSRFIRRINSCDTPPWYDVCCSVCCRVLQCVAACVAVCCALCVAECCSILQRVLQCVLTRVTRLFGMTYVAVRCSALQCVLQCVLLLTWHVFLVWRALQYVSVRCSVLQCVAVCCSML